MSDTLMSDTFKTSHNLEAYGAVWLMPERAPAKVQNRTRGMVMGTVRAVREERSSSPL